MKILTILGSPRKHGNTERVLEMAEDYLRASGFELDRVNLVDHKLGGCMACFHCRINKDQPDCAQNDDGNAIFNRMIEADAILYATPLFCMDFSAQMKCLIDRSLCFVHAFMSPEHSSLIEGKPTSLIVTGAGPIEGNFDCIGMIFKRYSAWTKLKLTGMLMLPFCSTPEEMGDEVRAKAEELAFDLTESF